MKKILYSFVALLCIGLQSQVAAQTPCNSVTEFPFNEGFEVDSPTRACWTQEMVNGNPEYDKWLYETGALNGTITQAHSGELNARAQRWPYSDSSIYKLVSPKMDVTSLETPTLSFYHAQEAWGLDQSELKIYYRLNETSAWIQIQHYWTNIANWQKEIIELPEKSATLQIAFETINNFGRSVVVDDVMVANDGGEVGSCMPNTPSNHFESGNGDLNTLYIANDFTVNAYTNLNVSQIVANIIEKEGIQSFEIAFYTSNGLGHPDEKLASWTGLTASSTTDLYTTDSGFTFQENVIDLPSTYVLKGGPTGTKYWLAIKTVGNNLSNNAFWESTTIMNSPTVALASNDGVSWVNTEGNMDGVFSLQGTCEPADPTEEYCTTSFWYVMPITSVKFADLDNPSSATSTIGYENFSDYRANVNKEQQYNLEIESTTYPSSTQNFTVFIDWNRDGKLNDDGEVYQVGTITNSDGNDGQKITFPITIPATAGNGEVRMRIVSEVQEYVTNPCSVYMQGQTEDYTLVVEDALATSEATSKNFQIYPNPTDSILFIKSGIAIEKNQVYNLAGQLLLEEKTAELNLSNLAKGVYLLKTTFKDGTVDSKKIIKK